MYGDRRCGSNDSKQHQLEEIPVSSGRCIPVSCCLLLPSWPDALDPAGKAFTLSKQGKGAIAVFLLAGTWWVFEVIPIGVTSLAIGVLQVLFMIRPPNNAFKDFMDPSVLFIFGSIVIGLVSRKPA